MHLSVIIFLISHIISAIFTFRINDQILIEGKEANIFISEHQKLVNLKVKKINYELTNFGIPINIKGEVELPNGFLKEIKVNHPIKVDNYHFILKDITGFLTEIELSLESSSEIKKLTFKPNQELKFHNYKITILNISDDISNINLKIDDGKNVLVKSVKSKDELNLDNQKFIIQNITPKFQTALVVDIVYDPSLLIIFFASTLFTTVLTIQFLIRINKNLKNK
jgi:hypothetical protein